MEGERILGGRGWGFRVGGWNNCTGEEERIREERVFFAMVFWRDSDKNFIRG
jgi:hypothetical protein